jgi:hypothetical protein
MSAASKATGAKRVAKKEEAVAAAPAPAAAAPAKEVKKAEKKVAAAAPAAAAPAPAPVVAAPVASAVAAAAPVEAAPTTSLAQDIEAVMSSLQVARDSLAKQQKALQALLKRAARELKEAGKRRRRNKRSEESGEAKEKRPTIFTTQVTLKDDLAHFLGKPKGSQMTPTEAFKAVKSYIDSHKLKNEEKGQGHNIYPDAAMRKALGIKEGESVTYRNIQTYLYKQYVLPAKKA